MKSLALATRKSPQPVVREATPRQRREALAESARGLKRHFDEECSSTAEALRGLRIAILARTTGQPPFVNDAIFREELEPVAMRALTLPADLSDAAALAAEPLQVVDARIRFLRLLEQEVPEKLEGYAWTASMFSELDDELKTHELCPAPKKPGYFSWSLLRPFGESGIIFSITLSTLMNTTIPRMAQLIFACSVSLGMFALKSVFDWRDAVLWWRGESNTIAMLNAAIRRDEKWLREENVEFTNEFKAWAKKAGYTFTRLKQGVDEALTRLAATSKTAE